MKAKDIEVGGHYVAKVSGKLTTVRVDDIRLSSAPASPSARTAWTNSRDVRLYDVTNMKTGRPTTFRSAAKFRSAVVRPMPMTDAGRRVSQIEAKYGTETGATEAERREAQSLVENVLHPVDPE